MLSIVPFAIALTGGAWCLIHAYRLAMRFQTEEALPYLFIGACGVVVGSVGGIYTMAVTAQRDPDELASEHLKRGKNPSRWLLGPHLRCSKCGAKNPDVSEGD